jgi:uncharacterized membrane protein YbhN (UPF0104 family)
VPLDGGSGELAIANAFTCRETPRAVVKFNFRLAGMNLRLFQIAIGLACTFLFLAIAFSRVQLGAVSAALAGANPLWAAAAMLIYAGNLALRAWRWQVILRPVAAIPYPSVARALLVGYGLNAIMPARLGELFRAEFFKKTYGLSRVWGLTSIVIAVPASPPCADRRRHSSSRLGERALYDFGEAAI